MALRYDGKYKVGDKVRVRKWENIEKDKKYEDGVYHRLGSYSVVLCNEYKIKPFEGKVGTIAAIDEYGYRIKEDENREVLWIDEFFEGYAFGYGEKIKISNDEVSWVEAYYVGYNDGVEFPYAVVLLEDKEVKPAEAELPKFKISVARYAKPLKERHTVILDNEEYGLLEDDFNKLKKFLKTHILKN